MQKNQNSTKSGVINIYKEKGYTSHDVVAKLRGICKQKKIGHTGTLDPQATGVLPVCFGKATKLCSMLTDQDKTYRTQMLLGTTTDTQDIFGRVQQVKDSSHLTKEEVEQVICSFRGEYAQVPPMYSALKVNGKKLYELAREGKEVERKPRTVTIFEIRILSVKLPRVEMEITCSKGTYIRTLCHDIGEKLGCGACMEALTRVRVGPFSEKESYTIEQIEELVKNGKLSYVLTPIDVVFSEYPALTISSSYEKIVYNGGAVFKEYLEEPVIYETDKVRVYDSRQNFIGIYQWNGNQYQLLKMFYEMES